MGEDERVAEILGRWRQRREAGEPVELEQLIEEFPEYASRIADHVAAERLLREGLDVPGRTIGDFRIVREIGRGGMGVVYEAEQISMRRRVALKVLSLGITGTPQAVRRFRREAQAAGRLHHTNIVPIYGLGQHGGHWHYAMELVEGRPLNDVVSAMRGAAPSEARLARRATGDPTSSLVPDTETGTRSYFVRVAEMFAGVADALHLAHQEGVIHRDIKPSNLLLDADGTLKIVDFGLALVADGGPAMTISGDLLGTPAYMSPEQATAKRVRIDHRTDVYSLSATLYEVLTLTAPFSGGNLQELCSQITHREPELPRRRDGRIPRDLETIVLKGMEKDRDRRYQAAGELARDLRRFAEGAPVHARRTGPVIRTWKRIKRHKARSVLVAGLAGVLVVCFALAQRAAQESRSRKALEYDRLVERATREAAQRTIWFDFVEHLAYFPRQRVAADLLTDAIALDATRPEAYLLRALFGDHARGPVTARALEATLDDLDHAFARGLDRRTYHLARAHVLGIGARWQEAAEAEQAAGRPAEALDYYFLARARARTGNREEALALLSKALDVTDAGDWARRITLRKRSELRWQSDDHYGALQDLLALKEHGGADVGTRLAIACCSRRLGQDDTAQEQFRRIVEETRAASTDASWSQLCAACSLYRVPSDWWLAVTEEAVASWPASAKVWMHRAFALLASGEESLEACRQALVLAPNDAGAHRMHAFCLWQSGRKQEALREYDAVLELAPDAVRPRLTRAMILADFRRFEDALDDLDVVVRWQPWNDMAYLTKARCLRDNEDRLAAISEAIRLAPAQGSHYLVRAHLYADDGKAQDALRDVRRAMELNLEAGGFFLAGTTYTRIGVESEEALRCLRRAVELRPDVSKFHWAVALQLLELKRFDEALPSALKAVELDDRSADAHAAAARAFAGLGKLKPALEHSNRALRLGFDDVQKEEHAVAVNVGLLAGSGNLRKAVQVLQRLVQRNSSNIDALATLMLYRARLGEHQKAERALGRLDQLRPPGPVLLNALAWITATGAAPDAPRAVAYAQRARALDEENANIQNTLGVALYRADRLDDALAALTRSMDLGGGGSACDWLFVAMVEHRLEHKNAREWYDQAVAWMDKNKPDDEELNRFRAEAEAVLGIDRE